MSSKYTNGLLSDLFPTTSLLYFMYSGMGPILEMELLRNPAVTDKGIISYDYTHVFDKCTDDNCDVCKKYKGRVTVNVYYAKYT